MPRVPAANTERLVQLARDGDESAVAQLLEGQRDRLRQMVASYLDQRVSARVDPSDIVQETLMHASKHIRAYLRERPVPFYPWLRQLARQRLAHTHRRHLGAQKRNVQREATVPPPLPDESRLQLVDKLTASVSSPSMKAVRGELLDRTRHALEKLPAGDREILQLKYLEQMDNQEIAAVLHISASAASMRHMRAVQRLRRLMGYKCGD